MTNFRLPYIGAEAVILGMAAFTANAKSVEQQLAQMGRASYMLERTSRGAFNGVAASANSMFGVVQVGATLAIGAITAIGTAAVLAGQRYERSLQNLGAISESTSGQLNELSRAQLQIASNSVLGATELQKASSELVKAGVDIKDVTGSALSAVNDLLIISEGELKAADAGVALQVSMRNFHATAKEAVDTTTAAVLSSTLTFSGYADAMKAAGPVAAAFGLTLEEFGATVGTVGLRIASGATIGAGLQQMFQRLQAPTDAAREAMVKYGISLYDAAGAARPWRDVIADLNYQFSDAAVKAGRLTQAERDHAVATIFSTRASRVANVVIAEGTQAYDEMLEATKRLEASKVAEVFLAQTGAKAEIAANRINALGIAFGQGLDPYINAGVTSLVKWLQSIDIEKVFAFGQLVGGTLYTAFSNIGAILDGVLIPAYATLFEAIGRLVGASDALFNITGLLQTVFQVAGKELIVWAAITAATIESMAAFIDMTAQVMEAVNANVDNVVKGFGLLVAAAARVGANILQILGQFADAFIGFGTILLAAAGEMTDVMAANFIAILTNVTDVSSGILAEFALLAAGSLPIFSFMVNAVEETMNTILDALNTGYGGWSGFWNAAQQAVITAVQNILKTINLLLDEMGKLPILGGLVNGARATIGGFFTAVPGMTAQATTGLTKFTVGAGKAFTNFQSNVARNMQNFSSILDKVNADARAKRDEMLKLLAQKPKPTPDVDGGDTEPGFLPDKGAADKAAKQLQDLLDKAEELWADFGKEITKEQRKVTSDIEELYQRAADSMAKALVKSQKEITDAQFDAYNKTNQLAHDRIFAEDEKARRKSLELQQKDEALFRKQDTEDAEAAHKRDLENDAIFARELREQREKEFDDYLSGLALRRDRDREDEDRVFEASQQARADKLKHEQDIEDDAVDKRLDTRERELEKEQDGLERALRAQHEVRERALEAIQEAEDRALEAKLDGEERALKKSQDQREAALQATLDAEATARDQQHDLAEINRDDATARADAQKEYNEELAKGVKQSIAQTRLNEKLTKINKDTGEKRADLTQKQADAKDDADFEAAQEARLAALRAQFEAEDLAREAAADAAKLALEAEHDRQTIALKATLDAELLTQQEAFEQATFELRKKNEEEKTRIQGDQEKARHALANKLEYEALIRSREREDEDRKYAEEQTKRKNAFTKQEEDKARIESRRIEDAERMRHRDQEEADVIFHEQQEREKEKLEKQLDDEGYNRRLFQIGLEAMERINVAKSTLAEEQQITRDKLAQDVLDLEGNLEDRIKTIRENYLDKLQDIVKDGGAKLQPVVDEVTGNINEALDSIRSAAEDATAALLAMFDAQRKSTVNTPTVGNRVAGAFQMREPDRDEYGHYYGERMGAYTYIGNGEWAYDLAGTRSDTETADSNGYPRYDRQGTVPGPWGMPVPIIAHGGEQFDGTGAYATTLAAVKAAESMWRSGIGGSTVTNNYSYQVDANYAQTQSPSSVARDLRALAILTR